MSSVNLRLFNALKAIIQPDNGRKIDFISTKEYYRAYIEGGELERAQTALREAQNQLATPVPLTKQRFAELAWMVGDITCRTNLTDEQAAEWLEKNAKHIRDRLCEEGNTSVIPTLLEMDGIEVRNDEDAK